jgi:hypothetical protein
MGEEHHPQVLIPGGGFLIAAGVGPGRSGFADLYTCDDDNHNISKYFTTAMDRTIAFFDQYLK